MKKLVLCSVIAIFLSGCSSADTSGNRLASAEPVIPSSAVAMVPNPVMEFDAVEDAVMAVGFDAAIPTELPDGFTQTYALVIDGKILEIGYDKDETNRIYYRTGTGEDDISGFYDQFSDINDIDIDGFNITTKGNDGMITVAIWQVEGISYSLAFPLDQTDADTVASIIRSVR